MICIPLHLSDLNDSNLFKTFSSRVLVLFSHIFKRHLNIFAIFVPIYAETSLYFVGNPKIVQIIPPQCHIENLKKFLGFLWCYIWKSFDFGACSFNLQTALFWFFFQFSPSERLQPWCKRDQRRDGVQLRRRLVRVLHVPDEAHAREGVVHALESQDRVWRHKAMRTLASACELPCREAVTSSWETPPRCLFDLNRRRWRNVLRGGSRIFW